MRRFFLSCVALVTVMLVPSAHAQLVGIESDTGRLYEISFAGGPVELTLIKETGIVGMASLEFFDGSLLGFTSGPSPTLYELSLEGDVLDSTPIDILYANEGGLVVAPDGTGYGVNGGLSSSPKLFHFNLGDGSRVEDSILIDPGFAGARDLNGLAWFPSGPGRSGPGTLLGLDRVGGSLITLDPMTGATARYAVVPNIGSFGVGGVGGMAVDPEGQVFFNTAGPTGDRAGSNVLYRFDPETRGLELIGTLGPTIGGPGISGLAIVPEPATISLLAIGGLAFLCRRRRWRL